MTARARAELRATALVAAAALVVRIAIAAWAWNRIPPMYDGVFYERLAARIASGAGFTEVTDGGTVHAASHYPVGYPAFLSLAYFVGGASPGVAMLANAALGAVGAAALHRALLHVTGPRSAFAVALGGFALHPALVFYTPAVMTEGVSASLVAVMMWLALAGVASERVPIRAVWLVSLGAVAGVSTLVRPQLLPYAFVFALVLFALPMAGTPSSPRRWSRAFSAAVPLVVAATLVAPWTARNCERLGGCALVSTNGGWNLLIGTDEDANGTWAPLKAPDACAAAAGAYEQDRCFEREARAQIAARPGAWLALAPKKLAATFNHMGAGPWYLHEANPVAFPRPARITAAVLEGAAQRVLFALALAGAALGVVQSRARAQRPVIAGAAVIAFVSPGWITALLFSMLAIALVLRRDGSSPKERRALGLAAVFTLGTALTHVVFFGSGRYGIVVIPAIALAAGATLERLRADEPPPGE